MAAVVALALWAFLPSQPAISAVDGGKTVSAAQIAATYGPSVVQITTPVLPAQNLGASRSGRIVGSGFLATKDGVIVTSPAVVWGHADHGATTVTVSYQTSTGEVGSVPGIVWGVDPAVGIALIRVDPAKLPLPPVPLGDSDSLRDGEQVVALSAQSGVGISRAEGTVTHIHDWWDASSRNYHVGQFSEDVQFPVPATGGPIFDTSGHVIGVVGPFGVGSPGGRDAAVGFENVSVDPYAGGPWGSFDQDWQSEAIAIHQAVTAIGLFSRERPVSAGP
jgi:S1-C subfamily serine protease